MDWALEFYTKQNQWSGVYEEAINDGHRLKAGWIAELVGPGKKRVLELGAGGVQVRLPAWICGSLPPQRGLYTILPEKQFAVSSCRILLRRFTRDNQS